jgi:hypothetical protein
VEEKARPNLVSLKAVPLIRDIPKTKADREKIKEMAREIAEEQKIAIGTRRLLYSA